jgi:hypothetical protein
LMPKAICRPMANITSAAASRSAIAHAGL